MSGFGLDGASESREANADVQSHPTRLLERSADSTPPSVFASTDDLTSLVTGEIESNETSEVADATESREISSPSAPDSTPFDTPTDHVDVDFQALYHSLMVLYQESSEKLRKVLSGQQPHCSDSEVPIRYVAKQSREPSEGQHQSLLPAFTIILPYYHGLAEHATKSRHKTEGSSKTRSNRQLSREEMTSRWLYRYVLDYISYNQGDFRERDVVSFTQCLITICEEAKARDDIETCLAIFYAMFSRIPLPLAISQSYVSNICIINLAFTKSSRQEANVTNLLTRSPVDENVLQALLEMPRYMQKLSLRPQTRQNACRGALKLLREILQRNGPEGGESVNYDALVSSLHAASSLDDPKVCIDVLTTACKMLGEDHRVQAVQMQNWPGLMLAASNCDALRRRIVRQHPQDQDYPHSLNLKHRLDDGLEDFNSEVQNCFPLLDEDQKKIVYQYFRQMPERLNGSQSQLVMDYIRSLQVFWSTSIDAGDASSLEEFVQSFLHDHVHPAKGRLAAAEILAEIVHRSTTEADVDEKVLSTAIGALCAQITRETDPRVAAALAQGLITSAKLETLEVDKVKTLIQSLEFTALENNKQESRNSRASVYATNGLIYVFVRSLRTASDTAIMAFESLVKVTSIAQRTEARLTAMKTLFRVRCDSSGYLYIMRQSESEYIAAALCRTQESAEAFYGSDTPVEHRSSTDSSSTAARSPRSPPLWMYPGSDPIPESYEPNKSALLVQATDEDDDAVVVLPVKKWIEVVLQCLQQKDLDWELYSYMIVHLGAQLANIPLFAESLTHVNFLRRYLCEQVIAEAFHSPPAGVELKKADVALCIFNVLTPLISYFKLNRGQVGRGDSDDLVRAFVHGIGTFEGTSKGCIHALWICCLEMPASINRHYPAILDKMMKHISQAHLSMHILEFLAGLARLQDIQSNVAEDEVRAVFGICMRYLEMSREQRAAESQPPKPNPTPSRSSGLAVRKPPFRAAMQRDDGIPSYVTSLAYHTIIFWFLGVKIGNRSKHVSWLIKTLIYKDSSGKDIIDTRSQVLIDMMMRATYSDIGETVSHPDFAQQTDGPIHSDSWIDGMSIVTVETASLTGVTQIVKRQASGTTHALYQQHTAEQFAHQIPIWRGQSEAHGEDDQSAMFPAHVMMQIMNTAAPLVLASQPIHLPNNDDSIKRALAAFDRIPTVDGHKIGVIYVGPAQSDENSILSNTETSPDFADFLCGLGTKMSLEGARFNTQGLQAPSDGTHTYAWRDRVTEIVYHVPSMMPTDLDHDPQCINKKRHIGNDFVNVIFNRSGKTFDFNTIPSQFNYVHIIVTPAAKQSKEEIEAVDIPVADFFKVHVRVKEGFPQISPAADPKTISAKQLPELVRYMGLSASVFAQAWNQQDHIDDASSTWAMRLNQIKQLRDRTLARMAKEAKEARDDKQANQANSGSLVASMTRGFRKNPATSESRRDGQDLRERKTVDYEYPSGVGETLLEMLDFSKWTS